LAVALLAVLASWFVGCEREITGNVVSDTSPVSDDCFSCHNGQIDAQQGEWAASTHASGANVDYTNRPLPAGCAKCHNQAGYIDWITTGTLNPPYPNAKAIGCFACHNPHETGNFSLRAGSPVTLVNGDVFDGGRGNQCASCHQSRESVDEITDNFVIASSRFGPHHGPQSDILNASVMYTAFPGADISNTNHKTIVPNACVGCHMVNPTQHQGYEVGGHSNRQDDGLGNNLASNCTQSGCHDAGALEFDDPVTDDPFDFILAEGARDWDEDGTVEGYRTELDGLLEPLRELLIEAGILNPANNLARTGTYEDGHVVGAYWNYVTAEEDQSRGIHNFQLIAGSLKASIEYLESLPLTARADGAAD
jgi:hypothetical protein